MSDQGPIRIATVEDIKSLLQIERSSDGVPHWSETTWLSMLQNDMDSIRRHCVLVATDSDVAVGFVALSGIGLVAELESIAVSSAFRSRGLGRALCHAAMIWAVQQGARSMELEVRAASHVPRRLYVSLGFVEQGLRKEYYRDPIDDAVLMSMALPVPEIQE